MRIVIDLQGAQSVGSRTRGIGRYSSSLGQAMARHARGHEIVLALNGCFADAVDEIRQAFDGLVDPENVRVWYAAPGAASAPGRRAQERLYEAFLDSLQPDVVHVASLFEGLGDASVTSVGSFVQIPTAVTLYDLIPLINPHPYLDNAAVRTWYMEKVAALERASAWFAISESSRQEGIAQLGLDAQRCVNISTAAYDHFRKRSLSEERVRALRSQYKLHKPFIMYTGGIDHRKNLDSLIRAFALLPGALRGTRQLAIVCSARPEDRSRLLDLASGSGLDDGSVVVTGFVPEGDLVDLYNLCELFVFPSWHEGFGLPALEAMQCGAVVIGANTSSLPEVIGRDDALFDPRDEASIAQKMTQALTDQAFRLDLAEHGLVQAKKFSWDESARRALDVLEQMHEAAIKERAMPKPARKRPRPRMAYVSPLPPQRSGIAGYSADLLPELALHYEIDLISDLERVDDVSLKAAFAVRSVEWFKQNSGVFDRVLYHFGNSEFHEHMFALAAEIPGVVVLHDFFLGNVQAHREFAGLHRFRWAEALYDSHGYQAVVERFTAPDIADVALKYPCNFDVLRFAQGVIVHSPQSIRLANEWICEGAAADWSLIPLLRKLPSNQAATRAKARQELGLADDDILVCAFGMLGPTKLNHRLIDAWTASTLGADARCRLVFVGENDKSGYGARIEQAVAAQNRIKITGWADKAAFERHLAAADIAVQLRTLSRGETSASVLDAMSHEVATIANANGSMAFLPAGTVYMLPDEFGDEELIEALQTLSRDLEARRALGEKGRDLVQTVHSPAHCARLYADAVELFAKRSSRNRDGVVRAIGQDTPLEPRELTELAKSLVETLPLPAPSRQLFVDVSELVIQDSQSGIQRLVRALLKALFDAPPHGYRIEPVYSMLGHSGYRYARKFTLGFLGCPNDALQDALIDARRGDVFVGLDLSPQMVPEQEDQFLRLRHKGVRVEFVVYDLLPVLLSKHFAKNLNDGHDRWLRTVVKNDGALCISQAVADELTLWLAQSSVKDVNPKFNVRAFHLGADLVSSKPSIGLPADADATLGAISLSPSFLMVGTLEPRKAHEQVLKAFEHLWATQNLQANLVIVGKQGWLVDELAQKLRCHPENGKRLFWLERASDEYLERLYAASACLIAASEGEGFGLPLIEAARHKLPIIARDLPVFREVAGAHAFYFDGDNSAVAQAVLEWLRLFEEGRHPSSGAMPFLTWQQSAEQFKAALFCGTAPGMPQNTA